MTTTSLKSKKGFTIIETLVAIGVLTAIIIGAMSAVQRGLSSYIFSKDEITAFYLAQEGMEKIRNLRDENALNSRTWLSGLAANSSDPCFFGNSCTVSPMEIAGATRCTAPGSCPVLRQDPVSFIYGYNAAWTTTPFTREISFTAISATEAVVTVSVTWSKGGASRSFQARENLLNWQSP